MIFVIASLLSLFPVYSQSCPFGVPIVDPAFGKNSILADVKMDGIAVTGGKLGAFVGQSLRGIADVNFIASPHNKAFSHMALNANPGEVVRFEFCDGENNNFLINETLTIVPGTSNYGNLQDTLSLSTVDDTSPSIKSITSTTADGSYNAGNAGDSVNVTVNFSEATTLVGGSLVVTLETGSTDATVSFNAFDAQTSVSGSFTIASGFETSALTANSVTFTGTIQDTNTPTANTDTSGTLAIPDGQNIADSKAIVIDAVVPTITSVTSSTADDVYTVGTSIAFTVNVSEPVELQGGSLRIIFETGTDDAEVVLTDFSLTNAFSGSYPIQSGHNSADLDVKELVLLSGTLKDAAGNNADLASLPSPNLASGSAIVIDAVKPVITAGQLFTVDENAAANTNVTDTAGSGLVQVTDNRVTAGNFTNFAIATSTASGFVIDSATGQISVGATALDLETVESTTVTLGITVSDGVNTSDAVDVTINLNPVNDAPVAHNQQHSIIPGDVASQSYKEIILTGSDRKDVDGAIEKFIIVSLPDAAVGTITDSGGGALAIGSQLDAVNNQVTIRFNPATTDPLPVQRTSFQFNVRDNGMDVKQLTKLTSVSPGTVTIRFNLAPNSPASVSVTSAPDPAYVNAVLTAVVTPHATFDQDDLGDAEEYIFIWKKDGTEAGRTPAAAGTTSTIGKTSADDDDADVITPVTRGDWTCEVFAFDGISQSAAAAVNAPALTVQNTRPTISNSGSVTIPLTPDPALTGSTLTIDVTNIQLADADPGDDAYFTASGTVKADHLSISWHKKRPTDSGFLLIPGATGVNLSNTAFKEGDILKANVKAKDRAGLESTDMVETAERTISNTAPEITGSVTIDPSDPVFDSILTANTSAAVKSDADPDDTTSFKYQWERDTGSGFAAITTDNNDAVLRFSELSGSPAKFDRGDVFKFIVKANDGTVDSTGSIEAQVTIGNTAPVGKDATVIVSAGLQKNFMLAGTDSDMDTLTFSHNSDLALAGGGVLKGGETITVNSTTGRAVFTPGNAADGDNYTFTYTVNDTVADSAPGTITLQVKDNLPPEPVSPSPDPAVAITDKSEGDTLRFSLTAKDSADPSGTGSIADIEWLVDGTSAETDSNTGKDVNFNAAFDWQTSADTIVNSAAGKRNKVQRFVITARIKDNEQGTTDVVWNVDLKDVDRSASAPTVSITPVTPKTTDVLTPTVDTPSTDPDGDAVSGYEHTWENLTTEAAGVEGASLAADKFKKGHKVKLTSRALTNPYDEATPLVSAQGGSSEVTIVDTAIVANPQPNVQMKEDNADDTDGAAGLQITLSGTDPDVTDGIDSTVFTIVDQPKTGTLSGLDSATGALTYTPNKDKFGDDTFKFSVTAGGVISEADVTIKIEAVNDAPIAHDDQIVTTPGGVVTRLINGKTSVRDNDSDVDNLLTDLTVSIEKSPSFSKNFNLGADGTFSYEHDGNTADFRDEFTYTLSDGSLSSNTATVEILLKQPPVIQDTPLQFFVFKDQQSDSANASVGTVKAIDNDAGDTVRYAVNNTVVSDLPGVTVAIDPTTGAVTTNISGKDFSTPVALSFVVDAIDNGNPPQKDTETATVFFMNSKPGTIWVDAAYAHLSNGNAVDFPFTAVDAGSSVVGIDAFATIQDGIDRAGQINAGRVNVNQGTYNESIAITKGDLTITGDLPAASVTGAGANAPKIDGAGGIGNRAVSIDSGVSGVTIQGFEIADYPGSAATPSYGIRAMNTDTSLIRILNNHIHNVSVGIGALSNDGSKHDQWIVRDNKINDVLTGITLQNSPNSQALNNTIMRNQNTAGTQAGRLPTR